MTGPSLAPVLIPIVGTLSLAAWLIVVFLASRHLGRQAVTPRPTTKAVPDRAIRPRPASGSVQR